MDLATTYIGLKLKNPLIASASPLTLDVDNVRRLEDAGAAAVVLPSIFEEQILHESAETDRLIDVGADSNPETGSYFPSSAAYHAGPHKYLDVIRHARGSVDIPVIASLNGITDTGWTDYARMLEQAGAAALELNVFFVPSDLTLDGAAVERRHVDILRAVKRVVTIPVAIKLAPYFSAVGNVVQQLDQAGADGFVLFNRFYQPDIDLATLRLRRDLELSTPAEIRLPLLWIGVLAGRLRGSLAATTGVESVDEVIKYLMAGADAVMTTSSLLRHGVGHMRSLLRGLVEWLETRDLAGVGDIRGKLSHCHVADPTAFERGNYISILQGWSGERRERSLPR
jgi:dihydroorotate dehydrogenase (fumarate)